MEQTRVLTFDEAREILRINTQELRARIHNEKDPLNSLFYKYGERSYRILESDLIAYIKTLRGNANKAI